MFGLIFGTICLVLLIHNMRWRYAGYGPWGYGFHRFGHWHGPPWRGRFRRGVARHLMARLDTTPGQEKAIRQALETLRYNLIDARDEVRAVGRDLAQALGGDELDEQALSAALNKQEAFVTRARDEVVHAVRTVHQTLDGRQRKQLAEWIADGMSHRSMRGYDW